MKNLRVALVGTFVAVAFTLSACGGGGVVKEYEKLVDQMCKCKDKACTKKMRDKRHELQKKYKEPSKSDMKKLDKLDKKWSDCRKKAESGGDKKADDDKDKKKG